jgi:hypothetical protein
MTVLEAAELAVHFDFASFILVDCDLLEHDRPFEFITVIEESEDYPLEAQGLVNIRGVLHVSTVPLFIGDTRALVERHDRARLLDLRDWDFVAEGLVAAPSGCLTATSPPTLQTSPSRLSVPAGTCAARIAGAGYREAQAGDRAALRYLVALWPSEVHEARVLREAPTEPGA